MGSSIVKITTEEWTHFFDAVNDMFVFLRGLGYEGPRRKEHTSNVLGSYETIEYSAIPLNRQISFSLSKTVETRELTTGMTIWREPFSDLLNDRIILNRYMTREGILTDEYANRPVEEMLALYARLLIGDLSRIVEGLTWLEGYGSWGPWEE